MSNLYIDLSDYIPDPEVEAVNEALETLRSEQYDYYDFVAL